MTPAEHIDLRQIRHTLARRRWTAVVTSAGVGIILVALAARLGPTAAVASALFAVVAVVAAIRLAVVEDRRWRRAYSRLRTDDPRTAPRSSRRRSA
jgi:hypothetical protein